MKKRNILFWLGCFPLLMLFWIIIAIILGSALGDYLRPYLAAIFALNY